jgi:hypothetical protein
MSLIEDRMTSSTPIIASIYWAARRRMAEMSRVDKKKKTFYNEDKILRGLYRHYKMRSHLNSNN